jgi:hypothetical protein
MAQYVSTTENTITSSLMYFSSATSVPLKWSFPRMSKFDYTILYTRLSDGTVRQQRRSARRRGLRRHQQHGDDGEKSVGRHGPILRSVRPSTSGKFMVDRGSGFLTIRAAPEQPRRRRRRDDALRPRHRDRVGRRYKDVGSDGTPKRSMMRGLVGEQLSGMKNALHADPVPPVLPIRASSTRCTSEISTARVALQHSDGHSGTPSFTGDP